MPTNTKVEKHSHVACYHCGDDCPDTHIHTEEKIFCCEGCKMVYEIINQNGLCNYYDISQNPGINQRIKVREGKFAFLDNQEIASKLIHFRDGTQAHVTFYLPQMHCSSCIWLLEHLSKLDKGVKSATVNFLKRETTIVFNTEQTSLRRIAELLTSIGYEPHISLRDMDNTKVRKYDRTRIYKIGIAGFCFANIMLLSFPEYFSSGDIQEAFLRKAFSFINLGLSLPVFFYCSSEFFTSAYKSLKQKFLNIDAPIALAILITFGRSLYEILSQTGAGYLDSMSGIVFFMLLGRFFQNKTYENLAFDRDFRSYFPIGVTRLGSDGSEDQVPVGEIKKGDRLRIHSHEIIPADGMLFLGKGNIDYSFVTGESLPSEKVIGELVYAGGKQIGAAIEIEVVKEVSQSYLTQLWNNDVFKKQNEEKKTSFVHRISRYFTYILFSIAALATIFWLVNDSSKAWNALTACLIVACPCALLLSATFTNGNMLSKLQKVGFFVKSANALESIAEADTIVFDKTGTISLQSESSVQFQDGALSGYEQQLVRSLAIQSSHPLSKAIVSALPVQKLFTVKDFKELKGRGSVAVIDGQKLKLGSEEFVSGSRILRRPDSSKVFVSVNDEVLGYFAIKTQYRSGLSELINQLNPKYQLSVISGDNNAEERNLMTIFNYRSILLFEQSPQEKLEYIKALQNKGRKVIMVGDGLNDAGALQQSNAGIVISDDINNFSPACDAILDGRQFSKLAKLLAYCRKEKSIIYGSFIISILYNIVGLSYAVQGELSPVIAAILMPVSSVSIVLYTTLMSSWFGRKLVNNSRVI
ncbi:MAG: heavy metal translocating P-type ATPase metal-binding domain-containing protein [Bacteroidia bacterium]|nr:heavy metal translocating P-type ATPase metal-binding domain-containing protein [Bacteroidia bacterium]